MVEVAFHLTCILVSRAKPSRVPSQNFYLQGLVQLFHVPVQLWHTVV